MVSFKGYTTIDDLKAFIALKRPSLYHSSTTSTVIPFTKDLLNFLEGYDDLTLVDLTSLPKKYELIGDQLFIEGPVTWKEALDFCQTKGRDLACYPTEKSACILGGIATSATGDRCFGFGNLRELISEINYLDFKGEEKNLKVGNCFPSKNAKYAESLIDYNGFKNPPYPRFQNECDLMIGTEGQLGVITSCLMKTIPWKNLTYIFLKVPHWKVDYSAHVEVHNKVQSYRGKIYSCELIDQQLLSFTNSEIEHDYIAFELPQENLDFVYKNIIDRLSNVSVDDSFEVTPQKYRDYRQKNPALLAEYLKKAGILKMGTDVQVKSTELGELFKYYQGWTDIEYTLFGHLGDAHLHFNFLPQADQRELCHQRFKDFYKVVKSWQGSPFAEHGIGVLKKDYLYHFLSDEHFDFFKDLKTTYDPENIFFPMGFMSIAKRS